MEADCGRQRALQEKSMADEERSRSEAERYNTAKEKCKAVQEIVVIKDAKAVIEKENSRLQSMQTDVKAENERIEQRNRELQKVRAAGDSFDLIQLLFHVHSSIICVW